MSDRSYPQRLKNLRKILKLSQREMAKEFQVTGAAVAQWETGRRAVPGPVAKLIEIYEESLGLSANDFDERVNKLSSAWSDRLYALLKTESSESLSQMIKKYLTLELPQGKIAQKFRISLLQRTIESVGLAKGLPLKAIQILTYMNPGFSSEVRNMILELKFKPKPMAPTVASRVFFEEFGISPQKAFACWCPTPFKTASLGQVHEATLHSGEKVAVKIQYPEISRAKSSNFSILSFLNEVSSILKPDSKMVIQEIRTTVINECDYSKEAFNQEKFSEIFKDDPHILVPKVFWDYCSSKILTTEFIDGQVLTDFLSSASDLEKSVAAKTLWKFCTSSLMNHNIMHADIQSDNLLFVKDKMAFLDYGRVVHLDQTLMENHHKLLASIINNDVELAKQAVRQLTFIRNFEIFDFDEFWNVLRQQQAHLAAQAPFAIDEDFISQSQMAVRSYSGKNNMSITADLLWSSCSTHGLWRILAELKAKENWGEETFKSIRITDSHKASV